MFKTFAIFFFLLANFSFANAANIGVVDIENIIKNSRIMANIKSQIEAKTEEYQMLITEEEKKLKKAEVKFKNKSKTLSAKAIAKDEAKLQEKFNNFVTFAKDKENLLKEKTIEATNKVQLRILKIIKDISTKRKLDVVLQSNQTLFLSDNAVDISEAVLTKLNKNFRSLKISFE